MNSKMLREYRRAVANEMQAKAQRGINRPADRRAFDLLAGQEELLTREIEREERESRIAQAATQTYGNAFNAYLRYGLHETQHERGMAAEMRSILMRGEQRDMGTGGQGAYPGSPSGFIAPLALEAKVEGSMSWASPMMYVADIIPTLTGTPLPYPSDNDASVTGCQIDESEQVTVADVPLGQTILRAYKFSSRMVKVSIELLQDSAFDIEDFLVAKFAQRLGRAVNGPFTTGLGTSGPRGILTGVHIGVGGASGVAVVGADNAASPDPTQQVGYTDLLNLEQSLDFSYRRGAAYMVHPKTATFIRTLSDKQGHPLNLWKPPVGEAGFPTINGFPVIENPDMPTLAPGATTVIFGALNRFKVRRTPLYVQRISERYADMGQVAFIGFERFDSDTVDAGTHPIVGLTQAA